MHKMSSTLHNSNLIVKNKKYIIACWICLVVQWLHVQKNFCIILFFTQEPQADSHSEGTGIHIEESHNFTPPPLSRRVTKLTFALCRHRTVTVGGEGCCLMREGQWYEGLEELRGMMSAQPFQDVSFHKAEQGDSFTAARPCPDVWFMTNSAMRERAKLDCGQD